MYPVETTILRVHVHAKKRPEIYANWIHAESAKFPVDTGCDCPEASSTATWEAGGQHPKSKRSWPNAGEWTWAGGWVCSEDGQLITKFSATFMATDWFVQKWVSNLKTWGTVDFLSATQLWPMMAISIHGQYGSIWKLTMPLGPCIWTPRCWPILPCRSPLRLHQSCGTAEAQGGEARQWDEFPDLGWWICGKPNNKPE